MNLFTLSKDPTQVICVSNFTNLDSVTHTLGNDVQPLFLGDLNIQEVLPGLELCLKLNPELNLLLNIQEQHKITSLIGEDIKYTFDIAQDLKGLLNIPEQPKLDFILDKERLDLEVINPVKFFEVGLKTMPNLVTDLSLLGDLEVQLKQKHDIITQIHVNQDYKLFIFLDDIEKDC